MATNKRTFTLRLRDEILDEVGRRATKEHRSMTNYIEHVLIQYWEWTAKENGADSSAPKSIH